MINISALFSFFLGLKELEESIAIVGFWLYFDPKMPGLTLFS